MTLAPIPSGSQRPPLDLVVIGRNSQKTLSAIHGDRSAPLAGLNLFARLIYVDSASSDDSRSLMSALGFEVIRLSSKGRLSASAGRQAGAQAASAPYVLFLDGDMRVTDWEAFRQGFGTFLTRKEVDTSLAGATGTTTDTYPDGKRRTRRMKRSPNGIAQSLGGFLLMDRARLLAAGGWNPDVIANEELELHARLRAKGSRILAVDGWEVEHLTSRTSAVQELVAAYLPMGRPQFGGPGMAGRAAWAAGCFRHWLALAPEPFLFVATALALASGLRPEVRAFLGMGYALAIAHRRSWAYHAVVPSFLLSIPWGWVTYRHLAIQIEQEPVLP